MKNSIWAALTGLALLSPSAFAGFISCNSQNTHCKISDQIIAQPEESFEGENYMADFLATVDTTCTHSPLTSSIYLAVGDGPGRVMSSRAIKFGQRGEVFQLPGIAPLKLVDTNRARTDAYFFDRECSLEVSVQKVPSRQTVDLWNVQGETTVSLLKSLEKIYLTKISVFNWFDVYIADPVGGRAVLETIIENLRDLGTDEAIAEADALTEIINGSPRSRIEEIYGVYSQNLQEGIVRAQKMIRKLSFIRSQVEEQLHNQIKSANTALLR